MERKAVESHEVSAVAISLLAELQLFFSRIEAKSSVILGVNTGMIWFLAAKLSRVKTWEFPMLMTILPIVLIAASLVKLYRCSFPQLDGGRESLVSFKEIAKRTQDRFLVDFTKQTREELALDLLGQVWQNSETLISKMNFLRSAYTLCAWAVLPWGLAMIVFVTR